MLCDLRITVEYKIHLLETPVPIATHETMCYLNKSAHDDLPLIWQCTTIKKNVLFCTYYPNQETIGPSLIESFQRPLLLTRIKLNLNIY